MDLKLKHSKCNQFGNRCRYVPLLRYQNSAICPVRAFRVMCSINPTRSASRPLFSLGSSVVSLDFTSFAAGFKRLLKRADIDPTSFSGHSFRRGGATAAFRAGVPGEVIQYLGGWASDSYRVYLNHDSASVYPFVSALSQFVHHD